MKPIQFRNLFRKLFILTAAAAAMPLAHAEGGYLGASIGSGKSGTLHLRDGNQSVTVNSSKSQYPLSLFGGVDLTPYLAVEAGVQGLGGKTHIDLDASHQVKVSTSAVYVAAKGTLALDEHWSLFGKLGVGQSRASISVYDAGLADHLSAHRTSIYGSVGVSYLLKDNLALQLELSHLGAIKVDGFDIGMNNVSLGLRYGF